MVSTPVIHKVSFISILISMRRFFIAIFRYLGVVGCLGLLSCLLIRSYFHISVPSLKSDPEVEVLILGRFPSFTFDIRRYAGEIEE